MLVVSAKSISVDIRVNDGAPSGQTGGVPLESVPVTLLAGSGAELDHRVVHASVVVLVIDGVHVVPLLLH